jgi:hypothetical protein
VVSEVAPSHYTKLCRSGLPSMSLLLMRLGSPLCHAPAQGRRTEKKCVYALIEKTTERIKYVFVLIEKSTEQIKWAFYFYSHPSRRAPSE